MLPYSPESFNRMMDGLLEEDDKKIDQEVVSLMESHRDDNFEEAVCLDHRIDGFGLDAEKFMECISSYLRKKFHISKEQKITFEQRKCKNRRYMKLKLIKPANFCMTSGKQHKHNRTKLRIFTIDRDNCTPDSIRAYYSCLGTSCKHKCQRDKRCTNKRCRLDKPLDIPTEEGDDTSASEEEEEDEDMISKKVNNKAEDWKSADPETADRWIADVNKGRIVCCDELFFEYNVSSTVWNEVKKNTDGIVGNSLFDRFKMNIPITTSRNILKYAIHRNGFKQTKMEFSDQLDRKHKHLFPIANNKVIDLKTKIVSDRKQEHLFTFSSSVDYIQKENRDPEKETQMLEILLQIGCESEAWLSYFQTVLGYSITGSTDAQSFWVWLGPHGSNGKGFLQRIINSIIGNFFKSCNKALIVQTKGQKSSNGEGPSPFMFDLKYGRFALLSETEQGDQFVGDSIRRLTGEDYIAARGLHKSPESILTQCKIHLQCNTLPIPPSNCSAFERRFRLILFRALFVPTEAEKQIMNQQLKIWDDFELNGKGTKPERPTFTKVYLQNPKMERRFLPGPGGDLRNYFFSWLVDGACMYYENPKIVKDMPVELKELQSEYTRELDPVSSFFEEKIVKSDDRKDKLPLSDLHCFFQQWHEQNFNRRTFMRIQEFSKNIQLKGYMIVKLNGKNNVSGIFIRV